MNRQVIPLSQRRGDVLIVAFFLLNLCFITYIVDFEQLVIPDATHFTYPVWPPAPFVDLVHWWGRTFDPLLMARPVWWKVTLLFDAVFFGPFYAFAIYAFVRGKEWIRLPGIVWASMLFTVTTIIVFEEVYGAYASPQLPVVLLANAPWIVMPIVVAIRLGRSPHPFTRVVVAPPERASSSATVPSLPQQRELIP